LVDLEGRVKMMLEELSGIQEAQLILMEGGDTMRSEHEELKIKYDAGKIQCSALNKNVNAITEQCCSPQRQAKLGRPRGQSDDDVGGSDKHSRTSPDTDPVKRNFDFRARGTED
jgi:hypothetical protein